MLHAPDFSPVNKSVEDRASRQSANPNAVLNYSVAGMSMRHGLSTDWRAYGRRH